MNSSNLTVPFCCTSPTAPLFKAIVINVKPVIQILNTNMPLNLANRTDDSEEKNTGKYKVSHPQVRKWLSAKHNTQKLSSTQRYHRNNTYG